jgi:uracil-DNA glycosylase family 4
MTIAAIKESIRKKIKRPVLPEGPADATLVFVGEAGGEAEERLGRPFVGRAGKFLDKELEKYGFERNKVYITNVVKYRCVGVPKDSDMKKCAKWLRAELEIIKPKIVVLLGKTAENNTPRLSGITYLALPHPSAAMRFTKMRAKFEEGMEKIRA